MADWGIVDALRGGRFGDLNRLKITN